MISDNTITAIVAAICTAIPLTIVAWRQTSKTDEKLDANTTLTKEVKEKADHIVALSNGTLAEVKKELASANGRIEGLQTLVKTLVERNGRVDSSPPPPNPKG